MGAPQAQQEIAVVLHAIAPSTFERCALIRDWLADHAIERVTLVVVPASDLHPIADRSGELVEWLIERRAAGDEIAQCGFTGRFAHPVGRRARGEFSGLDSGETRRAVDAGWRVMRLAGVEPGGFVAPAYSYTRSLHEVLRGRFGWWMGARRLYGAGAPPEGAPLASAISPRGWRGGCGVTAAVRSRAARRDPLLRVDLHPEELRPRQVQALEGLFAGTAARRAVTASDLATRLDARGGGTSAWRGASRASSA